MFGKDMNIYTVVESDNQHWRSNAQFDELSALWL